MTVLFYFADINECETSVCQQICTNTEGSFSCACNDGFELADDQRSCDGRPFVSAITALSYCWLIHI